MDFIENKKEYPDIPVDVEWLIEVISGDMIDKEKNLKDAVRLFRKSFVNLVLEKVDGDVSLAADVLKTHKNTIRKATKTK